MVRNGSPYIITAVGWRNGASGKTVMGQTARQVMGGNRGLCVITLITITRGKQSATMPDTDYCIITDNSVFMMESPLVSSENIHTVMHCIFL